MDPTLPAAPTEPSEGTDSDPDLPAGTMVGEYRVEGKLGEGGFGAVFKASHPLIGKQVAIKVLSTRFSADKEMVSRFQAEARSVNQIRHQNIIDIFSFGQLPDKRHYYVMELLDGEPLDRKIARGPLSLGSAVPILRSIARALDAAHAKGIAHRDLKAENVFLGTDADGDPFPKLLDFGIAKLMGDDRLAHKTRTGAPMGTPYYMSPEQTKGKDVDHRTDHYAFGVLVYRMLTGKYPIDGDDYMTIMMRQISDEPPPASTHVADLPPKVDQTIAWLMRKTPAERPPDLMTAVRALEEVAGITPSGPASGPVIIPSHVTAPTTGARSASTSAATVDALPRRSNKTGLLVGGAVVAIAAAVAIYFATRTPAPAPAPRTHVPVAAVVDAAPAVVADAATPTLAPVDAPAPPTSVAITLDGAPPTAEVRIAGKLYGTPPKVQIPYGETEVVLVLTADKYQPLSIPLVPSKDQQHPAKMTPRGTGKQPPRVINTGSGSGKPTDDIMDFPGKGSGS